MGTVAGIMAIPGLASGNKGVEYVSEDDLEEYSDNPLEISQETVTREDGAVSVCVAENTETGEKAAYAVQTTHSTVRLHNENSEVDETVDKSKVTSPEAAEELIEEERSDEFQIQTTAVEYLWDELPTEQEDYVQDWYHYLNDVGSCDADVGSTSEHQQFGVSVDYTEPINDLGPALTGAILGAAVGGAAGFYTAGPAGAAAAGVGGAVITAIVTFALDQFKDSTNLTAAWRETDVCQSVIVGEVCAPAINVSVSGRWEDERESSMPTVGYIPFHGNAATEFAGSLASSASDVWDEVNPI